ncbi:BolA-like protein 3 [Frankliniella fusca]|uniref:BolA-like protein 3 n=1 Tax=Frankliniella fusca TaxID=407009 RepID=A0AAE1GSC3_9NEOP|nr:BolA-like protein 3 [Frankliniella fusca]
MGPLTSISKEDSDHSNRGAKLPFNGYSDEFLDRLEPNGNIPNEKDCRYAAASSSSSGKFAVHKSTRAMSGLGVDQAHEQNNRIVKEDGNGAIG